MFLYASINAHKSWTSILEKLHHYQRTKTWWTWRVTSIIAENKSHAFHKTHFVYNESLQHPTMKFCSLRFFFFAPEYSLVPKKSTLSCDRIRRLTRPGKARHFSHQSFLSCLFMLFVTSQFSPVSTVSAGNAWTMTSHMERTREKKKFTTMTSQRQPLLAKLQSATKWVESLLPKGAFWRFPDVKRGIYSFSSPIPFMQCCATVRATYRKQYTPQLSMEGTGEGCWFFCSLKLPCLSLNNFVANCRLVFPCKQLKQLIQVNIKGLTIPAGWRLNR